MSANAQELGRRGVVSNNLSRTISNVAQRYDEADRDISRLVVEELRNPRTQLQGEIGINSSATNPYHIGHVPLTGSRVAHSRNIGLSHGVSGNPSAARRSNMDYDPSTSLGAARSRNIGSSHGVSRNPIPAQPSNTGHSSSTGASAAHSLNVESNHGAATNLIAGNANGSAPVTIGNAGGTRVPVRTRYCGQIIPVPGVPSNRKPRANNQDKSGYHLRCINCGEAFRDHRAVFTHFPMCVEKIGNVTGACWFDDVSIELEKIPEKLIQ